MPLKSFAHGEWVTGQNISPLHNAVTGEVACELSSGGLDYAGMLDYARNVGGPALRRLTFHQRALMLKALAKHLLEHKEELYQLSQATGATRTDSWIDIEGGIGTLFTYSGKGRRELPNHSIFLEGPAEILSREGTFIGQHICSPLEGVAVHINAFNFPCWGMLEKLAPTLLAGVPAIVKPASQTAYLTERMFQKMIDSEIFPPGSLQLICGSTGDLLDRLNYQDVVTFTGSASTGLMLKQHPNIIKQSVRFTMEADSLNCSILGRDAIPGSKEFDLYVRELAREMTVKAGQKCTAIRRAVVPRQHSEAVVEALQARLNRTVVGDPTVEGVTMGPLASLDQRIEVRERIAALGEFAETVIDGDADAHYVGVDADKGAVLAPTVLLCDQPLQHSGVHDIEAFGPVSTLMPYDDDEEAVALAAMGQGSLVASVFSNDAEISRKIVLGAAPHHGRILLGNRDCAKESTGHGSPLPGLVHGGPGRAGGGEEMGGIRGVLHYMQRTALQGSPDLLSQVTGQWLPGAKRREDDVHPFRKTFETLEIGDSLLTDKRRITLEDIEHFADFSGDRFYAHMDEDAARANPFFDGRVAHGYFLVSAAAGLFVDPAPGPVLANYGLDNLRFFQPVYPGDELQVAFTCKQKTARETEDYGEVRWDTTLTNQNGEVVAQYDVLTLVAKDEAQTTQ